MQAPLLSAQVPRRRSRSPRAARATLAPPSRPRWHRGGSRPLARRSDMRHHARQLIDLALTGEDVRAQGLARALGSRDRRDHDLVAGRRRRGRPRPGDLLRLQRRRAALQLSYSCTPPSPLLLRPEALGAASLQPRRAISACGPRASWTTTRCSTLPPPRPCRSLSRWSRS